MQVDDHLSDCPGTMSRGILLASDAHAEWLLPWFWKYYSMYNDFPVVCVDFGMSPQMCQWSRRHFRVVTLPPQDDFVTPKESLACAVASAWESTYLGNLWSARQVWFKKPLACLHTPFDQTVWLDTDCEVCGSLQPLFDELDERYELALVSDERQPGVANYSSGVILFDKNAPFLHAWSKLCITDNHRFMGDQDVLTALLLTQTIRFKEVGKRYNWMMSQGVNLDAIVAHWGAAWGKEYIRRHGGVHALTQEMRMRPCF